MKSRQVLLVARPVGAPKPSNFNLVDVDVRDPGPGEILVRNIYMSVDPYMRGRMNEKQTYAQAWQVGQPADGRAVGEVMTSHHPSFPVGALVVSNLGWREHFVSNGEGLMAIDRALASPSAFLGVLGVPGFTGWYGLKEIGKPKAGETLVVSGAAGATGSIVVQIGKILGLRVVGTAGTDDKCAWLTKDLGADAAINYRHGDLEEQLRAACPKGVDVYFENVGGAILDAVLGLVNPFARIALCGMISQYNLEAPAPGPRNLRNMVGNRVLMQGFIISDHMKRYPEFLHEVGGWLKTGRIRYEETVVEGIDRAVTAFLGLFSGDNTGKMVVRLGLEPARSGSR
ncbi:MAG TPA: NADP-dependent oxidoreductase [Candidatus Methylomirabilis sp.]|nr:NADP-dependent oxidoreductase [Candidatus Methylomirabilis sp.]